MTTTNPEGRYIGFPTPRTANHVAYYMGHPHVVDYLETVPEGSSVIDVGAGLSTLGLIAAYRRPDISWINFDIAYDQPEVMSCSDSRKLQEHKMAAPDNLSYVSGDILDVNQTLGDQRFTRVNSTYMIMHVILNGREQGVEAIESLLSLADDNGIVTVGPIKKNAQYVPTRRGQCLELKPLQSEAGNRALAELAVDAIRPFPDRSNSLFWEKKRSTQTSVQ